MAEPHQIVIVGAGLSGLATAHFLQNLRPGIKLLLLEQSSRPGGAIRSFQEEGFLAEWGPHGFLDNVPESRELLTDTGLDREWQRAPLGDFVRYLCHRGRLVALPQHPQKILATPLLSWPAKLRLLADLWKKPRPEQQTIARWAAYRFGEAIVPLVDAAVTGTFAGDPERLSIDAVMPGIRKLELEAGSVLKGLLRRKKKGDDGGPRRLPAMVSFPQGMERLVTVLAHGKPLRLEAGVAGIRPLEPGWEVTLATGEILQTQTLITALPVNQSLRLLAPLRTPPQQEIPEARLANVVLGFTNRAVLPHAFGYLAPERENRFTMGAMFSSEMFPGRAPAGHVLLEALVGGRRHPERLDLDDKEMVEKVYADVRQLLPLPEPPSYAKVLRSAGGIPQLEMDHVALRRWRAELEQHHPGLLVCGFGWDGVGMNDMMKAAKELAQAVAGEGRETQSPAVRAVYF